MITSRDRLILRHLEKYKYATIEQIEKIFFSKQKSGYNITRRRMNEIIKAGYVKVLRDFETNRLVYAWDDGKLIKSPAKHRLLVLDVLAELYAIGVEVLTFDIEKYWMDGKIRSDAFVVFQINNRNAKNRYQYFIEVHLNSNTYNLDRYDDLYFTKEVQKHLNRDVFPRVLLITDRDHKPFVLEHTKVVTINTKLDHFATVVLPSSL